MKKLCAMGLMLLVSILVQAQIQNPVKFSVQLKAGKTAEAELVFTGKIAAGWHVYSTNLPSDGPISATFHADKLDGVELVGKLTPRGKEIKNFDKVFEMQLRYFENNVQFVQKIRFTKPQYVLKAYLEYGACNDQSCLPPTQVEVHEQGKSPAFVAKKNAEPDQTAAVAAAKVGEKGGDGAQMGADAAALTSTTGANPAQQTATDSLANVAVDEAKALSAADKATLWKPVVDVLQQQNGTDASDSQSWGYIFLMGFFGGLLALFTPCVWPIIPMTVSFFLKRAKDNRRKGIQDALTYGASIVVIYLALGLIVTRLFGASALNALSTSALFNVFFFLMLVVFAVSFFGWFEIRLPDKWGNAVDTKASSTTGLLSIFLMAFTLALVSFSCTGPIIGFLLVASATSGSLIGPAVGMFGFALALALPFTLFAMFPSWLKSAPKSGSWMNTIKIVLGFIELAFSLKFLSVADLAYGWHILDREVFLSLWIVIFAALGLYLIGKLKFQSDAIGGEIDKPMPVPCIMLGLCSLAFAIYLVPGLWGAPNKAVSAFAPPMSTQDFNLNTKEVRATYHDYEAGMAAAAKAGKPALLDFTGFGCVNCRKMEAAVWTDPTVAKTLQEDYVLISLFVDDKTPLPQTMTVQENGQTRTLRTVGDKWSYLQRSKFGANAQPFYVPVDNEGRPLVGSYAYKEDVKAYLDFLQRGLEAYRKQP
ncbi:MAG: thioredoxin family protein [Prevotella sp.]|nr:thioredoxin family protein [Prevotella sp.]